MRHTIAVDLERARYLVSDRGRDALRLLAADLEALDPNRLSTALRAQHPPVEAAALAEQITLRAKAAERFGGRLERLYTADGLEMMVAAVKKEGVTDADIDLMMRKNPARLLGLES